MADVYVTATTSNCHQWWPLTTFLWADQLEECGFEEQVLSSINCVVQSGGLCSDYRYCMVLCKSAVEPVCIMPV